MKCFTDILAFPVLLFCFVFLSADVWADNPQGCLDCHAKVMENANKHIPASKKCEICHKPNGKTHPVEGVKGFTLVEAVPDLCYQCHDAKNDQKNVHTPVAGGKCLGCHNPHSSANEALLKYPKATLCQECHDIDMSGKKSQHKAVTDGNCMACHDAHQSNFRKQLKSESPELCTPCHEKQKAMLGSKTVHPPFSKNCLICHSGHNSDTLSLLKQSAPRLCYDCHDDVKASVQETAYPHIAIRIRKTCLNCHSPHASDEKKLLIEDEAKTCTSCHNKSVTLDDKPTVNMKLLLQNSTFTHGELSKKGCSGCHMPHGSANRFRLSGEYAEGIFTSPNKETFLICFNCHKSELLLAQTTETATHFRNGNQNLHYLHIQGSKTRNCNTCHSVHGALNSKLIAEKVPFGKWEMPIRFRILEKGGSCTPGCHSEKTYQR